MEKQAKHDAKHGISRGPSPYPQHAAGDDSDSSSILDTEEQMGEFAKEIREVNLKAELELLKKGPEKAEKIEKKRLEEIAKIEEGRRKSGPKVSKNVSKADRKAGEEAAKLEYILIENL